MPVDPERTCTVCGHWTCGSCGFRRPSADRRYPQSCGCGSTKGTFGPVVHQRVETAREHAQYAAEEAERLAELLVQLPEKPPDSASVARAREIARLSWLAVYTDAEVHRYSLRKQSPEFLEAQISADRALADLDRFLRSAFCACNCRPAGSGTTCAACSGGEHCGKPEVRDGHS